MRPDLLDMQYINSLPQPFVARMYDKYWWPVHDIDVQFGLVRIDVCGKLQVCEIGEFSTFKDMEGKEHSADDFYVDAERPTP